MKDYIRIRCLILLIVISSTLSSCDNTPDFDIPDNYPYNDFQLNTIDDANDELWNKLWFMSNVNVAPVNPNLLDYKLVFNYDGSLTATYGEIIYRGLWYVTDDNLNQDVLTDLKLKLIFYPSSPFDLMSKSWTFNSVIESYYNGDQIEFLHFSNDGNVDGSFILKEIK